MRRPRPSFREITRSYTRPATMINTASPLRERSRERVPARTRFYPDEMRARWKEEQEIRQTGVYIAPPICRSDRV